MIKIIKIISLAISLIMTSMLIISCGGGDNPAEPSETRSAEEAAMTDEVFRSLNNMYSFANSGDYESYIGYWDISDDEKALMLDNFNATKDVASNTYELESVEVIMIGEDKCNVTAKTRCTTKTPRIDIVSNTVNGETVTETQENETVVVIRETMYYVMVRNGDEFHILAYSLGTSDLVSYDDGKEVITEAPANG
ncbi:MAG: hypothetical protein K6D94_01155 [Clostridiales bacterium]|nr:hypothetical protein [Clostridiales bacterium]